MRPKTREEIAYSMGISKQTLMRWLKKENIFLPPRLVSVDDQITIYRILGFGILAQKVEEGLKEYY